MTTNENAKHPRCVSNCAEFVQCTLLSDNSAVRKGRRDHTVDHLILANIM